MSAPMPPPDPRPAPTRRPGSPWRVVVLVLVALVAIAAALALLTRAFQKTRVESTAYRQPVSRVVVDTSTGSIDVRPAAAGSPVTVQRTLQWSLGSASSEEKVSGDVLSVSGRCQQSLGFWPCSVSYLITVPPATALDLSSSTGFVQVRDLAGDVQARTSTGAVNITGLRAASVSAQTGTGSVLLRFAAPPSSVSARAGTGSVEVVVPGDGTAYDVRASTSTGHQSVKVPVDASSSRHITASTSTGSVEVRVAS